jgi:hypothetical protein
MGEGNYPMTNRERSRWKQRARDVIRRVIEQWEKENDKTIIFPLLPSEKSELQKLIDKSYPFGIRKNHPYACWLDVRAEYS